MKTIIVLICLFSGGVIGLNAQAASEPKLAAFSVDSTNRISSKPAPQPVLAAYTIDSTAIIVNGNTPELKATKKEDPIITPKN